MSIPPRKAGRFFPVVRYHRELLQPSHRGPDGPAAGELGETSNHHVGLAGEQVSDHTRDTWGEQENPEEQQKKTGPNRLHVIDKFQPRGAIIARGLVEKILALVTSQWDERV